MKNKIRLNIENEGFVELEVDGKTLEKFSKICKEKLPEKGWKSD